eukprot:gb/GECG01001038.1/.p1 GENE.gb/GECG01001038.1/~~gb/GECG01001038.1/.p1  ORF type:complete len:494 (+),score=73.89 gb/GECG01001038.1/:1-1482(+)
MSSEETSTTGAATAVADAGASATSTPALFGSKLSANAPAFSWGDATTNGDDEDAEAAPDTEGNETLGRHREELDPNQEEAEVVVKAEKKPPGFEEEFTSSKTWESLNMSEKIIQGVYNKGWEKPSRIQAESLPYILSPERPNIRAQAKNGSGKTGCFAIGMLEAVDPSKDCVQALSMAPTRELAKETAKVIQEIGQFAGIRVSYVVGGTHYDNNITDHVLVATPGKLLNLCKKRIINLKTVKAFVLDEADEFVESFLGNITEIKRFLPKEVQVMLFSASFMCLDSADKKAKKFADKLLRAEVKQPVVIEVKSDEELKLKHLTQFRKEISSQGADEYTAKLNYLRQLFPQLVRIGKTIIFTNYRKRVSSIVKTLGDEGFAVGGIDSSMEPAKRDETFNDFMAGRSNKLVCTDMMSKGIDVPGLMLVINFDVPYAKADVNGVARPVSVFVLAVENCASNSYQEFGAEHRKFLAQMWKSGAERHHWRCYNPPIRKQ